MVIRTTKNSLSMTGCQQMRNSGSLRRAVLLTARGLNVRNFDSATIFYHGSDKISDLSQQSVRFLFNLGRLAKYLSVLTIF
jgi:hypothetical protein